MKELWHKFGWVTATIVGSASILMKAYIKGAKLSLGGDNRLVVVLEDGPASDYFVHNTSNKEALENHISEFIGKEVSVDIQVIGNAVEFRDKYVDLAQIVRMEIEEE